MLDAKHAGSKPGVRNLLVITSLRRWDPLCKMREDVTQTHGLQVNETTCTFGVEQAHSFVIPAELWLIENRMESPPKSDGGKCSPCTTYAPCCAS